MPHKDPVVRKAYREKYAAQHAHEMAAYKRKHYLNNTNLIKNRVRAYRDTREGAVGHAFSMRASKCRSLGGDVTVKQLRGLWSLQKGRCALTGRKMLIANKKHHADCMSVDKIKHTQPYTLTNIRLVTWQANSARGSWSDRELIVFCKDILSASGRRHIQNQ